MNLERLDHLVLTVEDIARAVEFYVSALGMREVSFGGGRTALEFGQQKINLHLKGSELEPRARHPTPGSADLCFITQEPLLQVMDHLASIQVAIVAGPVRRTGALGQIASIYIRDPDGNLIEVSNYESANSRSTKH